jgi:hypothetical protein
MTSGMSTKAKRPPLGRGTTSKHFVGGNQRLIPAPLLSEAAAYTV